MIWKLKKDQEIMLTATAIKDTGLKHAAYEVVVAFGYKEIDDSTYKITFETDGSL